MELNDKRILVTGGGGFLGSSLVRRLQARGAREIQVPRSREWDLRKREVIEHLLDEVRPQMIFHLAAVVGGIGANREHPGRFFYDNAIMGLELIECARCYGVEKFVMVGTICAYPKHTPVPFQEDDLWNGYPEETNAPYGLAKKMMLVQVQAYRQEYGFNGIYLLPVNLYGPGDNFDLKTSHVIPALIRKCIEANETGEPRIVCWGDGSPTREFLYVEDAAEGLILAAERYDDPEPVNLGTGREIAIKKLVELIVEETGFAGEIVWDTSQPNGQPRRCLDVSRARDAFGFDAWTPLQEGVRRTVEWYRKHRSEVREVRFGAGGG